jgi:hypothetical protein
MAGRDQLYWLPPAARRSYRLADLLGLPRVQRVRDALVVTKPRPA